MHQLLRTEKILFACLFLVAAFVRFYAPLQYPLAINQDELSNIYDAWSIAETGKDRWETPNPFILRALGDGDNRPASMAWLIAFVFKFTGYSIPIGRMVNAVPGLLSIIFTFFFLKNSYNKTIAFAGMAVLVFSPWHILFSRIALEGVILPYLFLVLILYLWQKARTHNYAKLKYLIILGFLIGFSANIYQATKLSAPIIAFILGIDILTRTKKIKPVLIVAAFCLVGALPQLYSAVKFSDAFFARASTETLPLSQFSSYGKILMNLLSNFMPGYLFFSPQVHNNISLYRMYPAELVFFYTGVILLLINYKKDGFKFLLYLLFLAGIAMIIPSALTYSNPNAIRASGFFIFVVCGTAFGFDFITGFIKDNKWMVTAYAGGLILLASSFLYTFSGYASSVKLRDVNQQHYLVELYTDLEPYKEKYHRFYIENTTGESHLYLLAYFKVHPEEFRKMEKEYVRLSFDDFYRLDNYHYVKAENWNSTLDTINRNGNILVAARQQFDGFKIIDSSVHLKSVFYFMEPVSQTSSNAE
ncbi:MAG TPA: glycosyltransferase family 39 protein [Bacteroidia bacterium]|nr:glycosyltransferase family 39 protein [Bacteroidia bacterium]